MEFYSEQFRSGMPSEEPERELRAILEGNPDLEQYSPIGIRIQAGDAFNHLIDFISQYPGLITKLAQFQGRHPNHFAMLVIPRLPNIDHPLVMLQTGKDVTLMSPVTTCTLNAIGDLDSSRQSDRAYTLAQSVSTRSEINRAMRKIVEEYPNGILSYDPTKFHPQDYVSLGAAGWFRNEAYRISLRELLQNTAK